MFPEAGGSASFARRAFNEFWSFFAGWGQMLTYIITISISAFFVPHYLGVFWSPLGESPADIFGGIAVVVVLGARGTSSPGTASTARPAATRTPAATPTGTRTATPTATPAARSAQATATTTPSRGAHTPSRRHRLSATDAVRAFYTRAAAGDFAGAWALAGPRMRAAFGNSVATFERDLSSLRRVTFRRLAIASRSSGRATVTVETVALHTNRTDHCTGTLAAVQDAGGRWLVEPAGLQCRSG
jgi:hypothetical protein